jgi:hypothetical protein
MCKSTTLRRTISVAMSGPATEALERSMKRRRLSDDDEDSTGSSNDDDSFASFNFDDAFNAINTAEEEQDAFPTISWEFDDEIHQ